jgi:hypothetical protein
MTKTVLLTIAATALIGFRAALYGWNGVRAFSILPQVWCST